MDISLKRSMKYAKIIFWDFPVLVKYSMSIYEQLASIFVQRQTSRNTINMAKCWFFLDILAKALERIHHFSRLEEKTY